MSNYYAEDLDSLPIKLVALAMADEIPIWLATVLVRWHRFRARIGWPVRQLSATKWNPKINWSDRPHPNAAARVWGPWLEQFDDLGFEHVGWVESETIGHKREANDWLGNHEGTIFVQLNWTKIGSVEDSSVCLLSFLDNQRELQTISIRNQWQNEFLAHIAPDYVDVTSVKTKSAEKLLRAHQEQLALANPLSLSTTEFKFQLTQQRERFLEHSIKIGSLRELSEKEARALLCSRPVSE